MDTRIKIRKGNIIDFEVDAIVNAAKPSLLGGDGVDGEIHKCAGDLLLDECRGILTNENGNRCDYGEARITRGYNLLAKHVIHTVGPVWRDGSHGEPEILKKSYESVLQIAFENNVRTIAIPAISTGAYGYPYEEAGLIALKAVSEFLEKNTSIKEVFLVAFSDEDYKKYMEVFKEFEKS